MKHKDYSIYSIPLWAVFKTLFRDRSELQYSVYSARLLENVPDDDYWKLYVEILATFLWKFRQLQHFFMSPGVADFCAGSVKEFSEDFAKRLPECGYVPAPVRKDGSKPYMPEYIDYPTKKREVQGGFVVHFPTNERRHSLIVIPNLIVSHTVTKIKPFYFAACNGQMTTATEQKSNLFVTYDDRDWELRFIYGLSLYMDAFPDTVIPAGDDDVKRINYYNGQCQMILRNEIVNEEHRHSASPHWRRGHFRLLTSEKFIHKHGQTIYVHGTFVKGQAFDVLDDSPIVSATTAG